MTTHTKILVIGGGPAGSTAATFLSREGLDVTVYEKDFFPRYHIGESLIVSVREMLDLLGVSEKVQQHGFCPKSGGIMNWGGERWVFDWSKLPTKNNTSFQVIREQFDDILLNHAKGAGAKVFEGVAVESIEFEGAKPVAVNWKRHLPSNREATEEEKNSPKEGKTTFEWLVDCSGRNGLMATRYLKSRVWNDSFKNIAVWAYWTGIKQQQTETPLLNPIVLNSIKNGWIWLIPLHNGTTSVGVVLRHDNFNEERDKGKTREEIYEECLMSSTSTAAALKGATMVSSVKT